MSKITESKINYKITNTNNYLDFSSDDFVYIFYLFTYRIMGIMK